MSAQSPAAIEITMNDDAETRWRELVTGIRSEIDAGRLEKAVAARRIVLRGARLLHPARVLERPRIERLPIARASQLPSVSAHSSVHRRNDSLYARTCASRQKRWRVPRQAMIRRAAPLCFSVEKIVDSMPSWLMRSARSWHSSASRSSRPDRSGMPARSALLIGSAMASLRSRSARGS